jgi:hypothetical protein
VKRNVRVEVALSDACIRLAACGGGVTVVDRLSAWMARDRGIEIRGFEPQLELQLSVYRPWGVIASSAADAFSEHLINTTRSYMKGVDEGIAALGRR